MDITYYKLKDIYSGNLVRVNTADELVVWLENSYATLTDKQRDMIRSLRISFNQGDADGIKWYGMACGLEITSKVKRRKTK